MKANDYSLNFYLQAVLSMIICVGILQCICALEFLFVGGYETQLMLSLLFAIIKMVVIMMTICSIWYASWIFIAVSLFEIIYVLLVDADQMFLYFSVAPFVMFLLLLFLREEGQSAWYHVLSKTKPYILRIIGKR